MLSEIASGTSKPLNGIIAALTAEAWLNPRFAKALTEDKAAAIRDFAAENQICLPDDEDFASFDLAENPIGDIEIPPHFNQHMTATTVTCPTLACPTPACATSYGCSTASGCLTSGCWTSGCSAGCLTVGCIPYTSDGCSAGC